MESEIGFAVADYVVFVLVLLCSVAIGSYYALSGGKNKTSLEFHLGNRSMKILPLLISLIVSNQSSIMMLGYPAEVYLYGGKVWLSVTGYTVAFLIAVKIVVPLFHPLKITSVNEYFELRYGARAVRRFASICGALVDTLYSGLAMYGPAIALEGAVGVPMWVSILAIAASSIVYTSLGGIKAVVWTDVFQCIILYMGVVAVLIRGIMMSGGLSNVWNINSSTGRMDFVSFDPDPTRRYTFWSLFIGSSIKAIVIPFRQTSVQRVCCTKTTKDAKLMFYLIGPAFMITTTSAMSMGLVAFAYYSTIRCDPIGSKKINSPNQLMPYMVLDLFQTMPGMSGLFMASLFSASLSTVSSNLSGLSAITLEDFIKPHFKKLSESRAALMSKGTVVIYGFLATVLAFVVAQMKGSLFKVALSILSVFTAPLAGMFLYSAFWPRASHTGCLIGGIAGMVFTMWISMGQSFSTTLPMEPFLPFAPMDKCSIPSSNSNITTSNTTTVNYNDTMHTLNALKDLQNSSTTDVYFTNSTQPTVKSAPSIGRTRPTKPEGLDRLYSISFYWFDGLALLLIFAVSIAVSYIVGRPDPNTVNLKYLLSVSEQFFPCLPHRAKVFLSCCFDIESRRRKLKLQENGNSINEQAVELIPESPTSVDCPLP